MGQQILLLIQILFPVAAGCLFFTAPFRKGRRAGTVFLFTVLLLETVFAGAGAVMDTTSVELFCITPEIRLILCNDGLSGLFCVLSSFVFLTVGVYCTGYFAGTEQKERFYGFYLITLGVLQGVGMSGNLVSFYLFYEWMTFMTVPFVLHNRTRESVRAARKYLFYSVTGATLVLAGIFLLAGNAEGLRFGAGTLNPEVKEGQVFAAAVLLILGFGTKAGCFPMHGWLPTAHPAAPAPASAVLSGVITKTGVLGLIRSIYGIIGTGFLVGTPVQTLFLSLSLVTVLMGSMLAYKEKVLKKRLAYSTVSQVSYILFGLALMTPAGFSAALLHLVFHSVIKSALFLFAGIIIHKTGKERANELRGLGKQLPVTFLCVTFASLALVGIPPASGFVSKWYLALGALSAPVGFFSYLGPAVLLVSALLTAGYLFMIPADGFFPGKEYSPERPEIKESTPSMLLPLIVFSAAAVLFGIFSSPFCEIVTKIGTEMLRL